MKVDMNRPTVERLNNHLLDDTGSGMSKAARMAMRAADRELIREHKYNMANACPVCNMVLPTDRKAECDCGYRRSMAG